MNFSSRVHISRAAYDNLKGSFEVEPGHGGDRDPFLADNGIETFLIVPEKSSSEENGETSLIKQTQRKDSSNKVNGNNGTAVQHLLQTLDLDEESNGDPDWKPEIPFGNVRYVLALKIDSYHLLMTSGTNQILIYVIVI